MSTESVGVFRATAADRGDGDRSGASLAAFRHRGRPESIYGVGLWVFIGVAATLFSLFVTAYIMRMSEADAVAIAMPPQVWVSTSYLVLGSVLMQFGAMAAKDRHIDRARLLFWAGGGCAVAFLVAQWWAWHALLSQQVTPTGNPGGSFFYLLSAMHGLHVAGGLIGWVLVARASQRAFNPPEPAWRMALCARYWHFLLLVWLGLLACFIWITPDVARAICRTPAF